MSVRILPGDCRTVLPTLPAGSVQCCVTSPPYYGLRDYGVAGQMGQESSPAEYVADMVALFREVRRVLADDGTLWLNIGDSYANPGHSKGNPGSGRNSAAKAEIGWVKPYSKTGEGLKNKDLIGIPWEMAFALRADGWYLRSDIIWHKPNPMPESCTDRPTSAHEHVFLFAKRDRYFYDADAIKETATASPRAVSSRSKATDKQQLEGRQLNGNLGWDRPEMGRNARNVWTIATQPYSSAHFATMPPALAERCIQAGTKPGDTVLDPFGGAGTTGLVADRLGRSAVLIELNPAYAALGSNRIADDAGLFASVAAE